MLRLLQAVLVAALLSACVAKGDPSQPIPTATIPATSGKADRLVIVLPGRGDNLQALHESGVADAIHQAWPDADVVFAELTLDFYREGDAPKRLRTEVIEPLRARGYREVWMAGASMGGMGTLMYDAQFPGELDGMILLAPYLGDFDLLLEIDTAGGIRRWNGGAPQGFTAQSWQRDVWRYIKQLADDPARSQRIWLAYGDSDRLRKAMPLFVPALNAQQVFVRDGGHNWRVWTPAALDILHAIDAQRATAHAASVGNRGRASSGTTSEKRAETRSP
ncbi:alpha/beta hydrolase-fold protein [Lysobacter sp. 2RAF19]